MPLSPASTHVKQTFISTGLPQIDKILGGGFPVRKLSEVSGKWSSGKTTLALQTIAQAQREGITCIFYDVERTFSSDYAASLGVDIDTLMLLTADTAEEGLDEVIDTIRNEDKTFIVIDAIGALGTKEEAEKSVGEVTVASRARLVSRLLRKIIPLLAKKDNAVLVLNHEYTEIGGIGVPEVKTSGGKSLEYYRSVWLRLKRTGMNVKVGDRIIGYKAEAEMKKNKVAPTEKMKAGIEMEYGKGFLASANIFEEALEKGLITRTGNTHWYGELKIGSVSRAKEWTKENMDTLKEALNA